MMRWIHTTDNRAPRVSVLVPYVQPSRAFLSNLVASIMERTTVPYEIIALQDTDRLGYGAMLNQLASMARGEYLLLMNDDMEFKGDVIGTMLKEAAPGKILGVRVIGVNGLNVGCFPSLGMAVCDALFLNHLFPRGPWPRTAFARDLHPNVPFDYVLGGAMMVHRDLYRRLNGFDTRFWAYYDDVDFCWRARFIGASVSVVDEAAILHYGGCTHSREQKAFARRSRSLFLNQHLGPAGAVVARALYLWHDAIRDIFRANLVSLPDWPVACHVQSTVSLHVREG